MPNLNNTRKPWIPKPKKTNDSFAYDERYHTRRWRFIRKYMIKGKLCVKCKEIGKTTPANTLGHVVSLSIDNSDENFWNGPKIPLCKSCNLRQAQLDKK